MKPPQQLWWVQFKSNGSKKVGYRHWAAPKGGKFSSLDAAKSRANELIAAYPDAEVKVLGTGLLTWTEISLGRGLHP